MLRRQFYSAPVAELVDAMASKAISRKGVSVRVRLGAPLIFEAVLQHTLLYILLYSFRQG